MLGRLKAFPAVSKIWWVSIGKQDRLAIGGLGEQTWPGIEVTERQTLTHSLTKDISYSQSSLRCNRKSSGRDWKTIYQECSGKSFRLGEFRGSEWDLGLL